MTLKHSPLTELIQAVLDGEASDPEARELEMRLAADPAARAEFEDWKRLFEALDAVPKEHAPEGLVASIGAAMPQAPGAPGAASQPFPGRRVLGRTLFGISRRVPTRSATMTEQSSRRIFAHRKAWLGAGIAAAAAVVVAQIAFDFPLPKDVVGTVIPAQRYRAAQNGSEQVQLGTRADQAAPTSTVPEASRSLAEKSAAESALNADLTAARTRADLSAAQLNADRATAQTKADLAAAQTKADLSAAQLNAGLTSAQTKADMTSAQTKADLSAAQLNAGLAAAQTKADMTAQLNAGRAAQAESKAERAPQP
jgi:anti-sigma factor RsiW